MLFVKFIIILLPVPAQIQCKAMLLLNVDLMKIVRTVKIFFFFRIPTLFSFSLAPVVTNPCQPSPCGPYSQCQAINGQSVCSCLPNMISSPPSCRPQCISDSDCAQNEACSNQKCINPCQGACARNAQCNVINHTPHCKCETGYRGDPFSNCLREPEQDLVPVYVNPCYPSPCGPNSICREINEQAACSCASEMIGSPPNCRPECTSNSECSSNLACINLKCQNPCNTQNPCASSAECKVITHATVCFCSSGLGDPLVQCLDKKEDYPVQTYAPCTPNPCGIHAICREQNGAGACQCEASYIGDPYQGCRPECILSSDCPSHLACINNKCQDPCPGTCSLNAYCQVINHVAKCYCNNGFTGDGYRYCNVQRDEQSKISLHKLSFHSYFTNKSNSLLFNIHKHVQIYSHHYISMYIL